MNCKVGVVLGENLRYHFPKPHPLNEDRYKIFLEKLQELLDNNIVIKLNARRATDEEILLFHEKEYLELVKRLSKIGSGYLDYGDTPAYPGVYEASAYSAGSTLEALDSIFQGKVQHAFNPTGGLHHAYKERASGFCVFNDICIGIEYARKKYGIKKILYFDIDAHHGDGVYYSYEEDGELYFVDIHEDGRFLFPGTGFENERGKGEGFGKKLNIPLKPYSGDEEFLRALKRAEEMILNENYELIILQCGADGLRGDPLTHLNYTPNVHKEVTKLLHKLSHEKCNGRLLALGGGGYNFENVANAWITVLKALALNE
jgi:acetoin utilization protein AcuC